MRGFFCSLNIGQIVLGVALLSRRWRDKRATPNKRKISRASGSLNELSHRQKEKEFVMTQGVTYKANLMDVAGRNYPPGTIILPELKIDLSLSLEEMIHRGRYANEDWALSEITEDRFPINRNVPERQYTTSVVLVPPYHKDITFRDQEASLTTNRLSQHGVVETLAIGEQYPHLQLAYWIIGLASPWPHPVGGLLSPGLWQHDGLRLLYLHWRSPGYRMGKRDRCVAAPQAVT
jgi:hypothetical protein